VKLLIAIIHRDDADQVMESLMRGGHRATRISTAGGFLHEGNATILVGAEAEDVPHVLDILKEHTHEHVQRAPGLLRVLSSQSEVRIGAATIFVLDLHSFWHF
jgi:uncharacterized protein YaaQ